ncbi:hypothetical protein N0V82_003691 [Gnomoniopsis sp. IMI 355080]|nr:hypothetical protein N0V82_003691 [Gnomoniopsis sp. IMI 355080]
MPLPPIATIAACGSVITSIKSSWELSRMLKRKEAEKRIDSQGRALLKDLRDAYLDGYMTRRSFDKWYDRYLGALAEKDMLELRKIREHVNLIHRDNKAHVSRRSTYPPSSSVHLDEKSSYRGRARSADRRHSTRGPPPVYTVEEYEEERRRPTHIETAKAKREHYYSHALPSPYKGEIEYSPLSDSFEESDKGRRSRHRREPSRHHRDRHADNRSESSRSHSHSHVERGRTRSRSMHTDASTRVAETTYSSDADSEGESRFSNRRREDYYARNEERGRGAGRSR